jgi:hypothetical protein
MWCTLLSVVRRTCKRAAAPSEDMVPHMPKDYFAILEETKNAVLRIRQSAEANLDIPVVWPRGCSNIAPPKSCGEVSLGGSSGAP